MLRGLGAPEAVSSAVMDAQEGTVLESEGCTLSRFRKLEDGVAFHRKDQGLPLNLGILSGLNYRWVPIPEGINRYMLTIKGLPEGDYEIRADGRSLGKTTAARLERGLNISSMTADGWEPGGPWDAQSDIVKELVDARDKVWMASAMESKYLQQNRRRRALEHEIRDLDDRIVALQRAAAKPYSYSFEIRKQRKKS